MNNYEINEETYAIISKDIGKTEIIEKSNDYIIDNDAYKVMDESCKYYGSSYKGNFKQNRKEVADETERNEKYLKMGEKAYLEL